MNGTAKILVIDDHPANLGVLVSFLKDQKFSVRIAENGEWALQVLESYQPDVIILDVMMPGMDGFETCRRIKANKNTVDIPVIFMTSLGNVEDKVTGFDAGGVDYITKPFQHVEVLARINAHIELRRQRIQLKEQAELLRIISVTDELTGLYNRRHMNLILEREFGRCLRYNTDLSCLLIDLDHFKKVNDDYGHGVGDIVLREIAQSMVNSLRTTDYAFRYGGEEFLILLPQTDIQGAMKLAETLREQTCEREIKDGENSISVTLSGGISSFLKHHPVVNKDLLSFADSALYQSKKAGRNRISVYDS
jgi:diguanylate cyclase (GGDEF)-like protein